MTWSLALAVAGAVGLFWLALAYSAVWQDEICYTDPAANLAWGRGFYSTMWPGQPAERFFASNTPLHPWLLAGLFRVFGFHRAVVMGMNLGLCAVACWLWWRAAQRFQFPCTGVGRLSFLGLMLFSSGFFYAAGFGRYDAVGMVALGGTAWVVSCRKGAWRDGGLLLCGAVLPWAGLQVAVVGGVWALLGVMCWRGKGWRELLVVGLGVALGGGLLGWFYYGQGVWDLFQTQGLGRGRGGMNWSDWSVHQYGGIFDPTLVALTVCALGIALASLRREGLSSRVARYAALAVLSAVWVSQGMSWMGRFPLYYSWMAIAPVALFLCAALESVREAGTRRGMWVGVLFLGLVWLPVWLVLGRMMEPRRDLAKVEALARQVARGEDVAVLDFASYYALKPRVREVYSADFVEETLMSSERKEAVSLLMVRPSRVERLREILGGVWRREPEALTVPAGVPLFLNAWDYQVEVWRREEGASGCR